jgi:hypothetical protein
VTIGRRARCQLLVGLDRSACCGSGSARRSACCGFPYEWRLWGSRSWSPMLSSSFMPLDMPVWWTLGHVGTVSKLCRCPGPALEVSVTALVRDGSLTLRRDDRAQAVRLGFAGIPVGILSGHALDEHGHRVLEVRTSDAVGMGSFLGDQVTMPAPNCARYDQAMPPQSLWPLRPIRRAHSATGMGGADHHDDHTRIATHRRGIHHGGAVVSRRLSSEAQRSDLLVSKPHWWICVASLASRSSPSLGSRSRDRRTIAIVNLRKGRKVRMHHLKRIR